MLASQRKVYTCRTVGDLRSAIMTSPLETAFLVNPITVTQTLEYGVIKTIEVSMADNRTTPTTPFPPSLPKLTEAHQAFIELQEYCKKLGKKGLPYTGYGLTSQSRLSTIGGIYRAWDYNDTAITKVIHSPSGEVFTVVDSRQRSEHSLSGYTYMPPLAKWDKDPSVLPIPPRSTESKLTPLSEEDQPSLW